MVKTRMNYSVEIFTGQEAQAWDAYVHQHRYGSYCHLSGWKTVVERAYGRPTYYWLCRDSCGRLVGLLPSVHIKHFLFGNSLVSMPYLDIGGILADNPEIQAKLLLEAKKFAASLHIPQVELRQSWADPPADDDKNRLPPGFNKVQMILALPANSELLFKGFKHYNDIRREVRKAAKSGLRFVAGGVDLLDSFYEVFAINMRNLGTPVHSRSFFDQIIRGFKARCEVGVTYLDSKPLAAGIIFYHRNMVSFPFAVSLRSHNLLKPFPLLKWEFLKKACDLGYEFADFGRSTIDSGPYRFKLRWGAKPFPLHWQVIELGQGTHIMETRSKFSLFSKLWQRLPITVTKIIGPSLRKYISL